MNNWILDNNSSAGNGNNVIGTGSKYSSGFTGYVSGKAKGAYNYAKDHPKTAILATAAAIAGTAAAVHGVQDASTIQQLWNYSATITPNNPQATFDMLTHSGTSYGTTAGEAINGLTANMGLDPEGIKAVQDHELSWGQTASMTVNQNLGEASRALDGSYHSLLNWVSPETDKPPAGTPPADAGKTSPTSAEPVQSSHPTQAAPTTHDVAAADKPVDLGTQVASSQVGVPLSPGQHEEVLKKLSADEGNYNWLKNFDNKLDKLTDNQLATYLDNMQAGHFDENRVPDGFGQYMILEPERKELIMDHLWTDSARERITEVFEKSTLKLK